MADASRCTYRVAWSDADEEFVATCAEFSPALAWLDASPTEALAGIMRTVAEVLTDLADNGEEIPQPHPRKLATRVKDGDLVDEINAMLDAEKYGEPFNEERAAQLREEHWLMVGLMRVFRSEAELDDETSGALIAAYDEALDHFAGLGAEPTEADHEWAERVSPDKSTIPELRDEYTTEEWAAATDRVHELRRQFEAEHPGRSEAAYQRLLAEHPEWESEDE